MLKNSNQKRSHYGISDTVCHPFEEALKRIIIILQNTFCKPLPGHHTPAEGSTKTIAKDPAGQGQALLE